MPDNKKNEPVDLTQALRTWAFRNGITPDEYKKRMGYRFYSHAWNVIARNGSGNFSHRAWGLFIWGFGIESFRELLKIAGVEKAGNDAEV